MPGFGLGDAEPAASDSSICWANRNQNSAIVTQYSWDVLVIASRASMRESAAFLRYCSDRLNADCSEGKQSLIYHAGAAEVPMEVLQSVQKVLVPSGSKQATANLN